MLFRSGKHRRELHIELHSPVTVPTEVFDIGILRTGDIRAYAVTARDFGLVPFLALFNFQRLIILYGDMKISVADINASGCGWGLPFNKRRSLVIILVRVSNLAGRGGDC